tara:strand:- start:3434 stop:3685 length:252 start_codon:yes stop_codon:yes gene_type:complete
MGRVKELGFQYEYITDKDKKVVIEAQLKALEEQHFSLMMIEPSKLDPAQQEAHVQWRNQKTQFEKAIENLRLKRNSMDFEEEE